MEGNHRGIFTFYGTASTTEFSKLQAAIYWTFGVRSGTATLCASSKSDKKTEKIAATIQMPKIADPWHSWGLLAADGTNG
jgi:hypothetical protein